MANIAKSSVISVPEFGSPQVIDYCLYCLAYCYRPFKKACFKLVRKVAIQALHCFQNTFNESYAHSFSDSWATLDFVASHIRKHALALCEQSIPASEASDDRSATEHPNQCHH
ncbi:hypothetical protein AOA60_28105 [Pseudomonas sp. 2822-17]|nr:hypothetical protein AOA60_28105 [Pseudomonas sp. 2822-17]